MAEITKKPGLNDAESDLYFQIDEEIAEKKRALQTLSKEDLVKRKQLEMEIDALRMKQIELSIHIPF